jgi:hypothetical protein
MPPCDFRGRLEEQTSPAGGNHRAGQGRRTARTTSRCSAMACSGVLPGCTRNPQYSATPKSGRNFAAVACLRRPGHVHPVRLAARLRDGIVRHPHQDAHVPRLVHRPLGKRAVAQVVPDQDVAGNEPGQPVDRLGEALPAAARSPRQDALDVERLVGDVPLDRQVPRRDVRGEPLDLACHKVRVAGRGDRVVGPEVRAQPVERADRERQPDLEPQPGGDHAVRAQRAEQLIGGDGVVDARPGVPAHVADTWPDPEHRRFVHMPRDPGRRRSLPHGLDRRVRPDEGLPLIPHPRRPPPGLAVGQREDQPAEVRRPGAQRLLRRAGRHAAHQQ